MPAGISGNTGRKVKKKLLRKIKPKSLIHTSSGGFKKIVH
jgi:hypothetical protein